MFNKCKQEEGETVDTFITSLSEHCEYGALREKKIRNRIVVGIRDAALSLKLQLMETLTLDKPLTKVWEAEAIESQQPLLKSDQKDTKSDTMVTVIVVHKRGPGTRKGPISSCLTQKQFVFDVADLLHMINSIAPQRMWYATNAQNIG